MQYLQLVLEFSLFAMAEHQTRYFHSNTQHEENRADPDIFWRQKHQYTA